MAPPSRSGERDGGVCLHIHRGFDFNRFAAAGIKRDGHQVSDGSRFVSLLLDLPRRAEDGADDGLDHAVEPDDGDDDQRDDKDFPVIIGRLTVIDNGACRIGKIFDRSGIIINGRAARGVHVIDEQ